MIHEDEWSGFLFFQIEGDLFEDPANVVIRVKDIYLQDIGTKTHTQFTNLGEEIVEMYNKHPEWMKCRMGLIHSHNSMPTFFSGEDMGELRDNSPGTDFYFSLIVNNKGEFTAKAAYMENHKTESVKKITFKNSRQEIVEKKEDLTHEQSIMRTVDFDVIIEENNSELVKRVLMLKQKGIIDGRSVYSSKKGKGSYFSDFGSFNAQEDREDLKRFGGRKMDQEIFQRPKWMDKTVDKDRQMSIPGTEPSAMDMDISKLCAKFVMVDEDYRGSLVLAMQDYDHIKKKEDIEEYVDAIFDNMNFIHMRMFNEQMPSSIKFNVLSYLSTMPQTNKFSKALIAASKEELIRKFKPVNKAIA